VSQRILTSDPVSISNACDMLGVNSNTDATRIASPPPILSDRVHCSEPVRFFFTATLLVARNKAEDKSAIQNKMVSCLSTWLNIMRQRDTDAGLVAHRSITLDPYSHLRNFFPEPWPVTQSRFSDRTDRIPEASNDDFLHCVIMERCYIKNRTVNNTRGAANGNHLIAVTITHNNLLANVLLP
jgi:hypothetical protein